MRKAVFAAVVSAIMILGLGCSPRMARTALVGAAIIGTAAVVADHAAHFHHVNCGCPRYLEGGHWVYEYQGGHEYYDAEAGVWYRY